MTEIRCKKCGKLLGYGKGEFEIKCPRCKTKNKVVHKL
ncbi:MAG: Com family DNA-binding transcriptional regulator [Clostridia bacterium]|jgi:LSD1 subclass zinc finger protein